MIKKIKQNILSLIIKNERKFKVPRVWSNNEIKKFAPLFSGKVVNVSGWTDSDKENGYYKDYFTSASEYWISNFKTDLKGMQGQENEFYLDLEEEISEGQIGKFDVVFNHTTLEHVYEYRLAFSNICKLSNDIVMIVVPYIQQLHGSGYFDYWRFTPYAMKKLFEENNMSMRYCSANGADKASIYLFCIGYRNKEKWDEVIPCRFDLKLDEHKGLYADNYTNVIGGKVI